MSTDMNEIHRCEVCGGTALEPVLDLGKHPMCDDLVQVGDARVCREYPIDILYCATCKTAHQRYQVPKHDLFPQSYHYRSRFTADVLNGMQELVAHCEARFGSLTGKLVLDIGCNDGSLLGFFRQRGAIAIGVEPTGAGGDATAQGLTVYRDYLSPSVATEIAATHGQPDFIVFTNVFAHIEDLGGVLASLRTLMSATTVIVIENHYLGAVLDRNQFDTFYHEHPRTYSFESFVHIARSLGGSVLDVEFPSRYGGNIRVFLGAGANQALKPTAEVQTIIDHESTFRERFRDMQRNVTQWKARKQVEIDQLVRTHGKLRGKAFPGRAAILVKLLGLDVEQIEAVHEKPGSMKIGHYLPGTRIPIVSDDDLFASQDLSRPLLNLAWHIETEIQGYLRRQGYSGPIVPILSSSDFD
jgi:SAM-dependent methyltransferase